MARIPLLIPLLTLAVLAACSPTPETDTRSDDEAAVRQLMVDIDNTFAARDLDRFMTFFDKDVREFFPGQPIIHGVDAIRPIIAAQFKNPDVKAINKTQGITVAASGDIAYAYGTSQAILPAPGGEGSITNDAKWVMVFKKGADGKWRIAIDIFNPLKPPAPAKE